MAHENGAGDTSGSPRARRGSVSPNSQQAAIVHGVPVLVENTRPDIDTAMVLARLERALALIDRHQPWRLRHVRSDIVRIAVKSFPCRGAYFPAERTILTELSFLARAAEFTDAVVASSILHEGVHARVDRMGQRLRFRHAAAHRGREERLCRRAEYAFGVSLPTEIGAPVLARVGALRDLSDAEVAPEIDWPAAWAAKARADRLHPRPE
jgi:hypothetical protein